MTWPAALTCCTGINAVAAPSATTIATIARIVVISVQYETGFIITFYVRWHIVGQVCFQGGWWGRLQSHIPNAGNPGIEGRRNI